MPIRLLWLFSGVYLLFLVSACRSAAEPAITAPVRPTATTVPEPVTITWAFWGDPWEVAINERVIEVFEADHPYIHVETFHRPWNDYFREMRSRFDAGETVADVVFWAELPNDLGRNYFLDLTPLMEAEGYSLDDFFPGLLGHFQIDGAVYGLPRDSDTKVIFYNKRHFIQAGLDYPQAGWTWEDLRQTALALKAAGVADYSFAYEANDWWMIWMWQNGIQVVDDKFFPTDTDLDKPEAAEAVQFLADLTNVDQVTPPYEVLTNSQEIATLFKDGELSMAFGNHALVPAFAEVDGLEWDVVGLPQKERRANLAAGAGYAIAANSPHQEAAWTFLKFLGGVKGQAIFAEAGVAVPARRAVAQSDVFMDQQPAHNAQVFLDETEIGEPTFAFPGAAEIMQLMNQVALPPVYRGERDARSAIAEVVPQIRTIIDASHASR